ncbi:MAG: TfoX/Sxy family protein [Verrucomicrobiota bacterium]
MTSEISKLDNLGPASEKMLNAAGFFTERDLQESGSVEAFKRVQEAGFAPSLNLLWAMEGVLTETPWELISHEVKNRLKSELHKES